MMGFLPPEGSEVYRTEYGKVTAYPNILYYGGGWGSPYYDAPGWVLFEARARGRTKRAKGCTMPASPFRPWTWFRRTPESAMRRAIRLLNRTGEKLARADTWAEASEGWVEQREGVDAALAEVERMLSA